ncbi:DNA mismatch repair protein MSH4-like [Magnolia sinica]|uniref:DNA mismatch repair protein MSH4-like n=1 Tax=Magnolia sinica TaxID=86752 RepID=UPI00265AE45B|nr:DNA mismatch repair protein MSH4-like [Magnolia sinica]
MGPTCMQVIMARGCFDDTKGAVLVKSLATKEPSTLALDTYYKQYYLCLAAAAATIKWMIVLNGEHCKLFQVHLVFTY